MIRNLKILGLALALVFVLSVVGASVASAQNGMLTSSGKVKLAGTDKAGTRTTLTTAGSEPLSCHGDYTIGPKDGTVGNEEHPLGLVPLITLTVSLHYSKCHTVSGGTTLPITITMNGCDFLIHLGPTNAEGSYATTTDIVCPAGKVIEIHIYQSGDTKHEKTTICTVTVPGQTGLTGGKAKNIGEGKIELTGPIVGIKTEHHGILCGGTSTPSAEEDLSAEVSGKNEAGVATSISLSHS